MKIPSLPPMPAVTKTDATKPTTAPAQDGTARSEPAAFSAIKRTGASGTAKPGMNTDQLSAMLNTAVKMMEIRNDTSMSESAKQKMLKPLEQSNRNLVEIAELRAEQEEKEKILEAASEDAQAIREAGEEIAASAETGATPSGTPANADAQADAGDTAEAAPAPAASTSSYSASSSAPAAGENVDTHA
ncbi:MAG: hypothetical protein ACN6O6_24000 [Pseudomonas sp.]|uniref:hypothetical protein n=1 Tax=Pseudomonas sp. TaxID=306 RepID=UPI003D112FFC